MNIKLKKTLPNAVIPVKEPGNAGMDLTAARRWFDEYGNIVYDTGIAIEIPEGYAGYLFPRSSISKMCVALTNSVGVIDSSYRGSILLKYKPTLAVAGKEDFSSEVLRDDDQICIPAFDHSFYNAAITPEMYEHFYSINDSIYDVGDRIAQLIILPVLNVDFNEVEELSSTTRGENGFGSTGK